MATMMIQADPLPPKLADILARYGAYSGAPEPSGGFRPERCNTGAGKRGHCRRGGIGCDVNHDDYSWAMASARRIAELELALYAIAAETGTPYARTAARALDGR